jgi:hypothetical protein
MNSQVALAALRTDRQPYFTGSISRACFALPPRWVRWIPAVPRASARVRGTSCCRGACGRWRCRWSAHPFFPLVGRSVVRIARRVSRCRLSRGGLVINALLGRARRARGCETPGNDRLETRAYAVERYLFRLGHAQRSARYATSVGQLVAGLAPVIGWGQVPRGRAERARLVRRHRRSVQRWLHDLQAGAEPGRRPVTQRDHRPRSGGRGSRASATRGSASVASAAGAGGGADRRGRRGARWL